MTKPIYLLLLFTSLIFNTERMAAQSNNNKLADEEIYTVVEDMPVFPGGKAALLKYLQNVNYPQEAVEHGIKGRIFVEFVIDKTGKTTNIKVARGVHPLLDSVAVNHIKVMPLWEPAKQRGEPVNVRLTLPFKFTLK